MLGTMCTVTRFDQKSERVVERNDSDRPPLTLTIKSVEIELRAQNVTRSKSTILQTVLPRHDRTRCEEFYGIYYYAHKLVYTCIVHSV